jgi:hypothetical protein
MFCAVFTPLGEDSELGRSHIGWVDMLGLARFHSSERFLKFFASVIDGSKQTCIVLETRKKHSGYPFVIVSRAHVDSTLLLAAAFRGLAGH